MRRGQAGFTLLEVLLSIGIMTLLLAVSLPLYQTFQTRNDLDITTQAVSEGLRRANTYARASSGDSNWGVKIVGGSATVFKGASYAARDTTADETIAIGSGLTPSGVGEIVFTKFTGYPNTTGNIVLASTGNDSRTITVMAKGQVTY